MKQRTVFLAALVLSVGLLGAESSTQPKVIDIVAKRYSFVPEEITIKKGDPVVLHVRSEDVTHGLTIKEFHIKGDVPKNKETEFTFTPESTGNFEGKCSHFCGSGHGSMKLTIHVTD